MDLVVDPRGTVRAIYSEAINLSVIGTPQITRASHVEPTPDGLWTADMRPLIGPMLGPFDRRSEALEAEHAWLQEHWLLPPA